LGWSGVSFVADATGLSRPTIYARLRELNQPVEQRTLEAAPVRCPGGGRRRLAEADPRLLEAMIDPVTRGDPESPLRWTCKSTRRLSQELTGQSHPISPRTIAALLKEAGYSLHANRKTREGSSHPDRNAQFEHINAQVTVFHKQRQPVISVDTKMKELVEDFKNGGREWHAKGDPQELRVHDFVDEELGKAIPYGVYDLAGDEG